MVRWLRELLYLHDTERWLFREFEVAIVEERPSGWGLRAAARGERYDPLRHRLRTELKAVTYHQISVAPGEDGVWRARVIFDI